jgi:ABC-2 type transport system permease protein
MRHWGGLRALPTLLRVGFSEAIAYRAEMLVWVLSTTMPLVMLLLWTAVAEAAPVPSATGRNWSSGGFVAYFLVVFVVRQLVSSWASWEINFEVRQGLLSARLLRPIHPIVTFAAQNLAYLPLRLVVSLPVVVILWLSPGAAFLTTTPSLWGLAGVALVGAWLISFFANIAIGALSLWMESSIKVLDVWLAAFFVFSGYLFPLELFPGWLRTFSRYPPVRYMVGLPVELLTRGYPTAADALPMLLRQWAWATGFILLAVVAWRRGIEKYQAFGG